MTSEKSTSNFTLLIDFLSNDEWTQKMKKITDNQNWHILKKGSKNE